jgi:hypothetical protein
MKTKILAVLCGQLFALKTTKLGKWLRKPMKIVKI